MPAIISNNEDGSGTGGGGGPELIETVTAGLMAPGNITAPPELPVMSISRRAFPERSVVTNEFIAVLSSKKNVNASGGAPAAFV